MQYHDHKEFCSAIRCYYFNVPVGYFLCKIDGKFKCSDYAHDNTPDCVFVLPTGELTNWDEDSFLKDYPKGVDLPDKFKTIAALCKVKKKDF